MLGLLGAGGQAPGKLSLAFYRDFCLAFIQCFGYSIKILLGWGMVQIIDVSAFIRSEGGESVVSIVEVEFAFVVFQGGADRDALHRGLSCCGFCFALDHDYKVYQEGVPVKGFFKKIDIIFIAGYNLL